MSREKKSQLNVRVSETLCQKVRNYANQEDIAQADIVQLALVEFFKGKLVAGFEDEAK